VYGYSKLHDGFDRHVVDGFVNGVAKGTLLLSKGTDIFDRGAVDGAVNGISSGAIRIGRRLRVGQTGRVQDYAAVIIVGLALAIIFVAFILPLMGVT